MKKSRRPREVKEQIDKIVNYYMGYVVGHEHEFRDFLEYYWSCMSKYSIEDYAEIADRAEKIDLQVEIRAMRDEINDLNRQLEKMYEEKS